MLVSTNLIAFIVRGLFVDRWFIDRLPTEGPTERVTDFLQREGRRSHIANSVLTALAVVVLAALIFGLTYYGNVYLALAACLLMAARMPDLLWEVKIGEYVTNQNKPKRLIFDAAAGLIWLAIPLSWYSLCYFSE
jgi:hypothetical protein